MIQQSYDKAFKGVRKICLVLFLSHTFSLISILFFISTWQLYTSATVGSAFAFCLAPLFFEYTAELAYPVPEGVVGGFLTCFNNLVGMVFLCLFFVPGITKNSAWMNYTQVVSALICIPAVLLTKESYRRLDLDVN